ncbi:hypothetical protein L2E82_50029 [Cichorium intybus]|nr:hypothetical protein L2E82_50029 [Cichorium intybus]
MKVDIERPMVTETKLGSGTTKSSTPLDYECNTQVNESVLHSDHDFVIQSVHLYEMMCAMASQMDNLNSPPPQPVFSGVSWVLIVRISCCKRIDFTCLECA